MFGFGLGTLRVVCPDIISGSTACDCNLHPNNFSNWMLGKAGIVGLSTVISFPGWIIRA